MFVEQRTGATSNWIDIVDRVLDKGIVLEASQRIALSLAGIDLVTVERRIAVVSIEMYSKIEGDAGAALPAPRRVLMPGSRATLATDSKRHRQDRPKRLRRRP
jgi:hypothetical protein